MRENSQKWETSELAKSLFSQVSFKLLAKNFSEVSNTNLPIKLNSKLISTISGEERRGERAVPGVPRRLHIVWLLPGRVYRDCKFWMIFYSRSAGKVFSFYSRSDEMSTCLSSPSSSGFIDLQQISLRFRVWCKNGKFRHRSHPQKFGLGKEEEKTWTSPGRAHQGWSRRHSSPPRSQEALSWRVIRHTTTHAPTKHT